MIKGNSYQLWVQTPDKVQDEQIISAEKYARSIKMKQI